MGGIVVIVLLGWSVSRSESEFWYGGVGVRVILVSD